MKIYYVGPTKVTTHEHSPGWYISYEEVIIGPFGSLAEAQDYTWEVVEAEFGG